MVTTLAAPAHLLDVQRHLHAAAHGLPVTLAGRQMTSPEYLAQIRGLVAAVRFSADTMLLPAGTPAPLEHALGVEVDVHRANGGGNDGYQSRPATAASFAAVLAVLADAIVATNAEDFDQALGPLVQSVQRARTDRRHNPLRGLAMPDVLLAQAAPFIGRVAAAAPRPVARPDQQPPSWIPQVVDEDTYRRLAHILPGTAELTGRRFTAVAVARVVGARSWAEAAQWAGWSATVGRRTAEVLTQRIVNAGQFWAAVKDIADELAALDVDWNLRRSRLRGLTGIDPGQLGTAATSCSPWTQSRRRCAAGWVWAVYTSSDFRTSPAMNDPSWEATTESRREAFRRFSQLVTPPLARALLCHVARTEETA